MNKLDFAIKRIFDMVSSGIGLILLSPLILLISVIVKLTSRGSVFFRQERIGRDGKPFKIVKFRSMVADAEKMTSYTITIKGDMRITPIGRILRRWKLDELPTLWNVVNGSMSLVGPRPDVPGYMDKIGGDLRLTLKLRPGITGPATLKYSNEEQVLAEFDDPVKYYDEVIFPDKVRINLEYMDNWSLWRDVKIILQTIFRRNY